MDYKRRVRIYDGLITESMLREVIDIVDSKGFRYGWQSNNNIPLCHWNLAFSKTGKSVENRDDISEELPPALRRLWERIQPKLLRSNPVLMRAYCNAHTYGTEGYVHKDSKFRDDLTAIIYLNRSWDANWAGETVLFDKGEIIKAVIPKWKRLLIFPSFMDHAARGVSRFCPEARIVLVFKARKTARYGK
jgi:SM-20-related protein